MKILLMGPPAAGKGTIGRMMSEELGIPLLSVGSVLRNMSPEHPRYEEIHSTLEKGELGPQDFIAELLAERVTEEDCENGYILDGWGRATVDLGYFDPGFDKVFVIDISDETVMKRITGRRLCTSNGKIYNIYTLPEEELKECTGELVQRADDTPEVVKHRLEVQKPKKEVLDYLEEQGNLIFINGEPLPEEILKEIMAHLKKND